MKVKTLRPITYAANRQGSKHKKIPAGVVVDIPEPYVTALLNDPTNEWVEKVKEKNVDVTYETKEVVPEPANAGFTTKFEAMSWTELQKLAAELGIARKMKKKELIEEIKRLSG